MKIFAAFAFTIAFSCAIHGQTFTLDDFETGEFSVAGSTAFSQSLPEEHVLGGRRDVSLSADTASVEGGLVRLVRENNGILTLNYGSFGDANAARHLHFDAISPDSFLSIEVPQVLREAPGIVARIYSFTIESGTPAHQYASAAFEFRSSLPLTQSIRLGDFVGEVNLRDIAGFQLQVGDIDFRREQIEVNGATLTVIPEPKDSGLMMIAIVSIYVLHARRRSGVRV